MILVCLPARLPPTHPCPPRSFAPGHDLVTEGDPADRFWVLVEGALLGCCACAGEQRA